MHLPCRAPNNCLKNHVMYIKDRHGYKAELFLVHFKNDAMKGPQHLPLAKENLEVITLLEQATDYLATQCELDVCTLFHGSGGRMYKDAYFSTVGGNLLTIDVEHRVTANTIRHKMCTLFRDWSNHPSAQLRGLTIEQVEVAAADMMLNSTDAWSIAYDDTNRSRATCTIMALWPKFKEFVHQQHLDKVSEEAWDPLTTDFEALAGA